MDQHSATMDGRTFAKVVSSTKPEEDQDHCCSLAKGKWIWGHEDWTIVSAPLPTRDYTKPVSRAIVTVDVEIICPGQPRHHPYDLEGLPTPVYQKKPWGICVNSRTEQFYVADREFESVLMFGPDGEFLAHIGGGPADCPGKLYRPIALAYDGVRDRLYVVDKDSHRIQIFTGAGQYIFGFGLPGRKPGQMLYPWGIAVSNDGAHVAIADPRNCRIQLFTAEGSFLRSFGDSDKRDKRNKDMFHSPRGVAFDPTDSFIYVTDFNLHCVFRLDVNCTRLEVLVEQGELFRPSGIDVDAAGNLVVCDNRHNSLKIFRPNGDLLETIKSIGGNTLHLPLDVAVFPAGYLAVLDLNGRVQIF